MIAIVMQSYNVAMGEKSMINTYSTFNTVDIRRKKNINIQKWKGELAREILNYAEIQTQIVGVISNLISLDSILLNDSLKMLIAHHRHFSNDISAIECHEDIFPFIILEQEEWTTGVSHQIGVSWNVMGLPPIFMLVPLLISFFLNLQWVRLWMVLGRQHC